LATFFSPAVPELNSAGQRRRLLSRHWRAPTSWAVVSCTNGDIAAGSVEVKADSVILSVAPVQFESLRAFRFGGFRGRVLGLFG
jgi:hypothetical protein